MKMNTNCPNCNAKLSIPEGFPGGKVKCPVCQKPFMCDETGIAYAPADPATRAAPASNGKTASRGMCIRKKKRTYAEMKRMSMSSALDSDCDDSNGNGTLCFWLGFIFWLFGVLVAAIVGKGGGAKKALLGMVISTVLYVLLLVALGVPIW